MTSAGVVINSNMRQSVRHLSGSTCFVIFRRLIWMPEASDCSGRQSVIPGQGTPVPSDSSLHPVACGRAIEIVGHIVFARPHQLNRLANGLRNLCRLGWIVCHVATTEATAHQRG